MNGCLQWALLYPSCEAKWKQTSPLALLPGFSTAFLSHYVQPERMKYILFSYMCSIKWQLLQSLICCNNHVVILPPADIPHNYGKKFLWTNISVDWLCTNILQKHFHDLISPRPVAHTGEEMASNWWGAYALATVSLRMTLNLRSSLRFLAVTKHFSFLD